jgi:hypothetical protein
MKHCCSVLTFSSLTSLTLENIDQTASTNAVRQESGATFVYSQCYDFRLFSFSFTSACR